MNSRFTPQQVTQAKLASRAARDGLRHYNRQRVNYAKPARGHMPFDGHRTCAQVRQDEEAARGLRRLSEEAASA